MCIYHVVYSHSNNNMVVCYVVTSCMFTCSYRVDSSVTYNPNTNDSDMGMWHRNLSRTNVLPMPRHSNINWEH